MKCPYCVDGVREEPNELLSPEKVALLVAPWQREKREHFVVLYLDTRKRLIGEPYVASIGSLNQAIIHPREILKEAILRSAHSFIITHNHPSGEIDPSPDDIKVTNSIADAANIVGIPLLDHIVHSWVGFFSLATAGLIEGVKCQSTNASVKKEL